MTISSATNKSGPYTENGVTTEFKYEFKIEDESHVKVVRAASGVETVLTLTTDYTVTGVGADGGGNVVINTPVSGSTLTLVLNVPFTQELNLENQGAYFAEVVEAAFDLATQRDKQLQEQIDRAVRVPVSADVADLDTLVAGILTLEPIAADITTVAGISANVTTVAGISANVTTVAGIAANVTTVAGIAADVTAVAADAADIGTVATNIANVNTVAGISANVTAVAGNATNINAVAGNATNINAVAANATNIDAVAANATNINAVAANETDIDTVAANIADVTSAANNMAAIIAAPTEAANAATSASEAAASAASVNFSAVAADILPDTDSARDLGSASKAWAEVHSDVISTPAIKFPATQVPSSDPNTLDDYEEGTFTATLVCGTSGTITLSTSTLRYVKIGRQVSFSGLLTVASVSSPNGTLTMTGLPFASENATSGYSAVTLRMSGFVASNIWQAFISQNVSAITIDYYSTADGSTTTSAANQMKAGTTIVVQGTYFTA